MADSNESTIFARKLLLQAMKYSSVLSAGQELELFAFYVKDSEKDLERMLLEEHNCVDEQVVAGNQEPNDSGIVAVEYFFKRVRYSHIIYLVSLLDTYLQDACRRVALSVGKEKDKKFRNTQRGAKWPDKKEFLATYGRVAIDEDIWKPIHTLIVLRNCFVHNNGSIPKEDKNTMIELSDKPGITVVGGEVAVEAIYIHKAFQALESLMSAIEAGVKDEVERNIKEAERSNA